MATEITVVRSDLIELRLKLLGGTGATLLERARSLQDHLGHSCMARIRAVVAMRERYAGRSATKPMGWIDRRLFLEDCELIDRRLHSLLEESKPRPSAGPTATGCSDDVHRPRSARAIPKRRAVDSGPLFATILFGLGEHVGPMHERLE